jgi:hypothetical protein
MISLYLGRVVQCLRALEQEDSVLAQVKADIALIGVPHGARKIISHKAMPMSVVFPVKFLSYILCNILKKENVSTLGNSQTTIQTTNKTNNQTINEPNNKPNKQQTKQRTKQPTKQTYNQKTTEQTNNQPTNKPNNQTNNQGTKQTTNQTTN